MNEQAVQETLQWTLANSSLDQSFIIRHSHSMKRLSPSPSPSLSSDGGGGFILLPLPPAPPPSDSKLRRCSSIPVDPPNVAVPPELMAGPRNHLPSQGLPLLRSISDPNPCLSYFSPPNPDPIGGSRVDSRSPSSGSDSPASKRLKRMGERMKEMKNWFDQLIQQTDQDPDSETGHEAEDIIEKKSMESEGPFEEEENNVSAERKGDAINIRCKCPCGDSYQILLLGQDYYYKLL